MESYPEFESINIQHPDRAFMSLPTDWVPLNSLYEQGWWITDIFGTSAIVVRKSKHFCRRRPDFCSRYVHIDVTNITPRTMRKIYTINNQQWRKYKHIMLYRKYNRY